MAPVGRIDRSAHLLGREHAALAQKPAHHHPGERRRSAGFGVNRMRRGREDDLVALAAVHARGDLVAHGARRQIDRGLLAQKIGDPLAQAVDRGVEHRLLVADLGLGDRAAHAGRGLGPGIAVEIDHASISSCWRWEAGATRGLGPQPDGGVVERSAAVRRGRLGADQRVDADALLERLVRPDALDHHHARLLALADRACTRTEPRWLPSRTRSPASMSSRAASSGLISAVGRPSLRREVGISVKLVFR